MANVGVGIRKESRLLEGKILKEEDRDEDLFCSWVTK